METQRPTISTLVKARQAAGRRYVQLIVAAAVTKFTTRTVSDEQMAEVRRAKAEWDATRQVAADRHPD
jgi:hypothetical protein